MQSKLDNLNLNIWDFAGQDIYHATHRLFMQTRALFVLVWDVASETSAYHEHAGKRYKDEKLQYWLEYARCFAPESPILVVKTKWTRPMIPSKPIWNKRRNITKHIIQLSNLCR